jgi:LysM repeat protein
MAEHTVARGETLSGIARQYGVSVSELADLNGIEDPDLIFAGQTLLLPEGVESVSTSDTPREGPRADTSELSEGPIGDCRQGCPGALAVSVVDCDGNPLEGADVFAFGVGYQFTTGIDPVIFGDVQAGSYFVDVSHPSVPGYTARELVHVSPFTCAVISVRLCSCSVQVGAMHVAVGQYHLFVVYNEGSRMFVYRGGPERSNPYQDQIDSGRAEFFSPAGERHNFWGRIVTVRMEGAEGNNDWQMLQQEGGTNIVTVAEGPEHCGLDRRLTDVTRRIGQSGTDYAFPPTSGYNSNSVVRTILHEMGLPERKPEVSCPLWENLIPLP